jgi:hypothetical protein
MKKEELQNVLDIHDKWINSDEGGVCADLYGADLYGADLRRADLRGANLHGEDLVGADLYGADLRRANLRRANLVGANLRRADLYGVDLRRANLRRANLVGANLRRADLRRADLRGAKGIMSFGPMPTSGRMIYAVWHYTHWMVNAGCFWGTLDELEAKVKANHNCSVYLGVIELLKNYNP